MAARYLARAVALPPSNTSWYMGLSNGAAGLCESSLNPIVFPPYWPTEGSDVSQMKTVSSHMASAIDGALDTLSL